MLAGSGVAAIALGSRPLLAKSAEAVSTPNAQMQAVLDEFASFNAPPIQQLSPMNARNAPTIAHAVMGVLAKRGEPALEFVGDISHILIPGPEGDLLARVYQPSGEGPFPVLVYFHGGGWVIANLDTYDSSCRALTNAANCIVISVAYRQAPEHKFPAAAEDAYAATQWAIANADQINGDPNRVAVGGESAGGNLAAVTCLMARDRGGRIPVHQLLIYPITNYAFDTPSYQENANAQPLNKALMMWFWSQYLNSESDGSNPYASPLRAESLSGLPPATAIAAQIDPLRSEGQAYAKRLSEAGVSVKATNYNGVTHEFFGTGAVVDKAKQAVKEAAAGLQSGFLGNTRLSS
ncbi:alpha/beta hydrolase [Scytonema sp. NUACC26]|uniref:alpha/beta hydrolase n=1 Tax=Scytonema sp. NUACC26 TaxID=3140176 RepID=UPI0034DBD0F2